MNLFVGDDDQTIFEIVKSKLVDFDRISSIALFEKESKGFFTGRMLRQGRSPESHRFFICSEPSNSALNTEIATVLEFFLKSVFISLNNQIPAALGIRMLEDSLKDHSQVETAFEKLQKITVKLDFGIERMEINRTKLEQNQSGEFQVKINPLDGEPIGLRQDKDGPFAEYCILFTRTQRKTKFASISMKNRWERKSPLVFWAAYWRRLKNGGIVLIDELDRSRIRWCSSKL